MQTGIISSKKRRFPLFSLSEILLPDFYKGKCIIRRLFKFCQLLTALKAVKARQLNDAE